MSDTSKSPTIALLGVPIEIGASQAGTLMGPAALRTAGIARVLEQLGLDVEDHGDMARPAPVPSNEPVPANAKYYDEIKTWIRALSERANPGLDLVVIFGVGRHRLIRRHRSGPGHIAMVLDIKSQLLEYPRDAGGTQRRRAHQGAGLRGADLDRNPEQGDGWGL